MAIRLIALDLDGTLLDSEKHISERNCRALEQAHRAGIQIVPSTGRFFRGVPEAVRALPFVQYAITINGAKVLDLAAQQVIYRSEIPLEQAERLFDYMDKLPVIYDCYQNDWGWMGRSQYERLGSFVQGQPMLDNIQRMRTPLDNFREGIRKHGQPIQKTQMFFQDLKRRELELQRMPDLFPEMSISAASDNNIEINSRDANKGAALQSLCRYLKIDISEVMAFGDGLNDLTMLQAAGVGVAMGNAAEEIQQKADLVTSSNLEDGVAEAIERYILPRRGKM